MQITLPIILLVIVLIGMALAFFFTGLTMYYTYQIKRLAMRWRRTGKSRFVARTEHAPTCVIDGSIDDIFKPGNPKRF